MTEMPDFNELISEPEKISEEELEALAERTSNLVYSAIQNASNSTERSEQQNNFKIGVSTLGHCRQYARLMIEKIPFSDVTDKTAAFLGTVTSEPIEAQIKRDHPDFIIQEELVFELPSGGSILGHSDIIIPASAATEDMPQMLIDLKSKAELETIKKMGRSQQQQFQLDGYTSAAIDKGYFDPSLPILQANVYYDRSGRTPKPYSIVTEYDPNNLMAIDRWMEDVKYAFLHNEDAQRDLPREFCQKFCFAGETEIVTRQGVFPIWQLDGTEVEVLAPSRQGDGLTNGGRWVKAPIRAYGQQALRRITLRRGRRRKEIYATGEHEWFIRERGSHTRTEQTVTTDELAAGMYLREIRHAGHSSLAEVPPAVVHGFVYGDGSDSGDMTIYSNSPKWESMERYFTAHRKTVTPLGVSVHGIPKALKSYPNLEAEGSYLMSWLAGYFAADGSVSNKGQATISTSKRDDIWMIRSICEIVGIRTGAVTTSPRKGFGESETDLHKISLVTADLPDWFFVNVKHAKRIAKAGRPTPYQWQVVSVEETERFETVYCAEVPEVSAFALADGILTHNCEYFTVCRGNDTDVEGLIEDPEVIAAVDVYKEGTALESAGKKMKNGAKEILQGVNGSTGTYLVREVEVGETVIPTYTRAAYKKISITKVKK